MTQIKPLITDQRSISKNSFSVLSTSLSSDVHPKTTHGYTLNEQSVKQNKVTFTYLQDMPQAIRLSYRLKIKRIPHRRQNKVIVITLQK